MLYKCETINTINGNYTLWIQTLSEKVLDPTNHIASTTISATAYMIWLVVSPSILFHNLTMASRHVFGPQNVQAFSSRRRNASRCIWTALALWSCHHLRLDVTNASILQNGSKSTACATKLLNILQLMLDSGAVTTIIWINPCHHGSICQNCSKSMGNTTNLRQWTQRSWKQPWRS